MMMLLINMKAVYRRRREILEAAEAEVKEGEPTSLEALNV